MEFLKSLFESGPLSWEAFTAACQEKGFKLADLSKGDYVSKSKFDNTVQSKDSAIEDLQNQLTTRDTDIANLRTQLETDGTDNRTKIATLTQSLSDLQATYDQSKTEYEERLGKQEYEFLVREFASNQKFTSPAAKREFERDLIAAGLNVKDKQIIGATDFLTNYKVNNAESFIIEDPEGGKKPEFVKPANDPGSNDDAGIFGFNFTGVRAH